MRTKVGICAVLLAAVLSGCGGGSSDTNAAGCTPTLANPNVCVGGGTVGATAATGTPTLALSLVDSSGAGVSRVAPDRPATLQASVRDANGNALPNVAVTFTTSDKTGAFVPTSGTALTDSSGVARVGLPAGKQAGGFTATATAAVSGAAVTGAVGYAVAFPTLALSPLTLTPATLSAGGNASVSVAVLSGGAPYTPPQLVSFTSPCVQAGKATIGTPVLTQSGTAVASYSDKGCGVADVISASVALGDATVTQTGTITVLTASAGSVKFVSADTTNIALRGTGGAGRQEFATLKFEVSDTTGNKISGTLVDFVFSDSNTAETVGGLTLNPTFATSAADGTVTTLVTAGSIPTSVRVVATIRGSSPRVATLSNVLVVSTGVPDQKHFSLATEIGNCEGRDFDQVCSVITATLGDHFGNPAPDGTAVNFSAEGGVVDASCVTGSLPPVGATPGGQTTNSKVGPGSGTCSVVLRSSSPRPANERVTILAFAAGEEDFSDSNGNNAFDAGDTFTDKGPDIFRDDNEDGNFTAGESCVGPNTAGTCRTPGDGQYNGVLRTPRVPSAQTLYVSDQLVQTFSGSFATITFNSPSFACPASRTADVQVKVTDVIGTIMPAATLIEFSAIDAAGGVPVNPGAVSVNNVALAIGEPMIVPTYTVTVSCGGGGSGKFIVNVTTPRGIKSTASIPFN